MTRRGHLTCAAVITATVLCLGWLPMQMNPFTAIGIWIGSVVAVVMVACGIDEAIHRYDHRAMYSQVLREARKALK